MRIEVRGRETLGSEFAPRCEHLYAHFLMYTILV
jgi:hypothetical protein